MWGPVTSHGILEPSEKADYRQCCSRNPERMNVWDKITNTGEIQQQCKGPRPERGATSEKQEDIT
jgi:hypothetical protein